MATSGGRVNQQEQKDFDKFLKFLSLKVCFERLNHPDFWRFELVLCCLSLFSFLLASICFERMQNNRLQNKTDSIQSPLCSQNGAGHSNDIFPGICKKFRAFIIV